jgi:dihydrofolate reductase
MKVSRGVVLEISFVRPMSFVATGGLSCRSPARHTRERTTSQMIGTALSTSLDGFIAGADNSLEQPRGVGGDRLFNWLRDGDTPSRYAPPSFKMSAISAAFFDEGVSGVGAVIAGRRTYDVNGGWGGAGPIPGVPLFVMTHRAPDPVSASDPPHTFVTHGIESAAEKAQAAAAGKNVHLMGANIVQQCIRAGLLDELTISLVPVVLGDGVRLLDALDPGSVELDLVRVIDAPGVTHLTYRVVK